jgi:hypothetical protein
MEVHHLKHKERKKWSEYIFEFAMLFLAVFLGYLAENGREHRIEKKREKAMMVALLNDLQADMRHIDSLQKLRIERNDSCDKLISLLTTASPIKENGAAIYYYGRTASRRIHFRPQDGVLQQLRTSGGFRVLHNSDVAKDINSYELNLKLNQENIEVEEKELTEYTAVAAKVFDVSIFQRMMKPNIIERPEGNPALRTYDPDILNELAVKLHYWKRTSLSALEILVKLKEMAVRLEHSIREEYHLK